MSPHQPITLRATSSLITFWVVVAAAALGIGDAAVRGSWPVVAHSAAPVALGLWVAWFLLYRPSIRLERDRLVAVNVGRVVEVPWDRIVDARRRFQIVLELDDASTVECWGGPFPGRTGARAPAAVRGSGSDDAALDAVRLALHRAQAAVPLSREPAAVRRRWDARPLVVGAVLVALCAVTATLPF